MQEQQPHNPLAKEHEQVERSQQKKKIANILLIKKGIDYINNDLAIVKFKYMKNDLLNNSNYDINIGNINYKDNISEAVNLSISSKE